MYYKEIDGQIIFNSGTSLKVNGRWISNPPEEVYFQEGWQIYTPPPFVPEPQDEPYYEQVVEAVKKMFSTDTDELSDEDALDVAALYPTWRSKIGEQVAAGKRLWDDGKLWKVLQPHTVQENWRPEDSPSLYVEVTIEEWPEWKQPTGSTDAYMAGAKVTHNEKHWISNVDYNSWEPGVYGWTEQS